MDEKYNVDPEAVLREWRTKILNGFLFVAAGIAGVMTVATMLDVLSSPGLWPAAIVYLILAAVVGGLAVFRGIDYRLRAWSLLLICYIAGLTTLATFGLGSSGRLYMLAVPILALILIGTRPGIALSGIDAITVVVFAILADQGVLGEILIRDRNSLLLSDWLAELADTLGILSVVMVLLILFYRFQESMIARARRAQTELFRAQSLLEDQNATLEQKVEERTSALQASNHSLEQRNAALGIINSVSQAMTSTLDVKTMTRLVGDKLLEIFEVDSALIMLLDKQTNLIHVTYEYDRGEGGYIDYVEPFPLGTGLSSTVILSGQPLLAGTLEEEIAHGAYFPPEIIEKGSGFFSQSWLGVPIIASDQVLGVVALSDNHPHAFNPNHMRLLQTLASNLGAAIENMRLFEAEQQRVAELAIINSLQEALASRLDLEAVFERIGEKICEVFNVQVVDIVTYDKNSNLISMPYSYEKGDRTVIAPREPYGFRLLVINSREPILINENFAALASQHDNPVLSGACPKSALFMPLLVDDQIKGVISIQDLDHENAFSDSDVRLLKTLANAMSVAIENARLFDETQRLLKETQQRAAELAIINSVQAGLASKLDMQAIYELVGEKIRDTFNAQVVSITTYDPLTQLMVGRYYFEDGKMGPGLAFPAFGFRRYVVENHKSLMINEDMPRWMQEYDNPVRQGAQSKSAMFIPMMVGEAAIGVISLQNMDREHAFSHSDLRLLETLANSMSIALDNARLFDETQRLLKETEQRNSELAIINRVQEGLVAKMDMQGIYDLVGDQICKIFDAQVVFIEGYEYETGVDHCRYLFEKGNRLYLESQPFSGLARHIIQTRQTVVINDNAWERATAFGMTVVPGTEPMKSGVWVPLVTHNEVKGLISLQNLDRENAFSDSDVQLLQTLANSMSVSLENARLFNETQRLLKETEQRAAELATVNTVSSAIASELDLSVLIQLVGEQIRSIFKTDIAYVALLDQQSNIINFPYQYGQELAPLPFGEGLTSKVIQSGQPLRINQEMEQQRQELGVFPVGRQARSYLGVPIVAAGETIGVISVQNTTHEDVFTENDQHLLSTIAANVGVALQNAGLFAQVQSEKKFSQTLIATSPVAILTLDQENRVTSWNPAAEKLFGYRQDEALGQRITDLVTTGEMRAESLEIAERMARGESVHSITRRCTRDGSRVDVELFAVPVLLDENRVGTFAIYHDISELKRAEAAIQESERRLADIINFLPDATLVIDHEGKVIAWNRAIEEMTGIAASEMIGKGNYEYSRPFYDERRPILIDLVHLPQDEIRKNYAQLQWNGNTLTGEAYTPALKGEAHYLYATASALHDARGNVVGAIETIRDITDRKQAEEDLKKARLAAEQANQAKSAFLANMSHELRTPLNAIIGFTRIVRRKAEGLLPEKQTENLEKVLTSAEHLLNLINTVLDIAKIEAGRMDVLAANFRIGALIDLCANTAQPLLKPAVLLEKQVDEHLNIVHSDQDKIRQIILNLLSNAAKFTHQGKIVLAAHQETENMRISVSDTGIGISAEALPRIFKEFQQADTSTTRQYGGTGLGLSISRNLARLLGGDLNVESELGQGSTFTLILPIEYRSRAALPQPDAESTAPTRMAPVRTPQAAPSPAPASARRRILVIDDDPDAVYLLQENLNPQEFEILGARNGEQGLRLACDARPHAILLDIVMPGADGWQVLYDLKSNPATADIPVVFLTIVDKKALGLQLGAAAYLLKPLDPLEVRETLHRVIGAPVRLPRRLLIVDDDPHVPDMLRQCLPESEFSLDSALDGESALQAVAANCPDIVLLDLIMPRLDGFGVIERLRADPNTRDLPVIVLSAKDLTAAESARLKETVALVMKKQGFEGEKLVEEIHKLLNETRLPA